MRSPGHELARSAGQYMKIRGVWLGQGRRGMEWLKRSSGIGTRHTRAARRSSGAVLLQWSNSQMARFPGAADLRAESDNVRDEKRGYANSCGLPVLVILIFLQGRTGVWVRGDATTSASVQRFRLVCEFSSLASARAIEDGPLCARVLRDGTLEPLPSLPLPLSIQDSCATGGGQTKRRVPRWFAWAWHGQQRLIGVDSLA